MAVRETNVLRLVLISVAGILLILMVWFFVLVPHTNFDNQISELELKLDLKRSELRRARKEVEKIKEYHQLSLPPVIGPARELYDEYLMDLFSDNGMYVYNWSGRNPDELPATRGNTFSKKKIPAYFPLNFNIWARGKLGNFMKVLAQFQRDAKLHRIKTMTVEPLDREEKSFANVNVRLTIEALLLPDKKSGRLQPWLVGKKGRKPVPSYQLDILTSMQGGIPGLMMVPWAVSPEGILEKQNQVQLARNLVLKENLRDYTLLDQKNIFRGAIPQPSPYIFLASTLVGSSANLAWSTSLRKPLPPPPPPPPKKVIIKGPDMRKYVYLVLISKTKDKEEAFLRNRATNEFTRVRPTTGYNYFLVTDISGEHTILKGKVLQIDQRVMYFESLGKIFRMDIGKNIKEALEAPLDLKEVEAMGIPLPKKQVKN